MRTNYLNLPTAVDFGSGNKIEWAYTVSGAKLRKTVYTNGAVTLTQDYVSGFVYKNGSLDFFSTETGRVKNQSGTLKYQYTLTDHLGNTRVMFEDNGGSAQLIEESHYYAFGMRIEGLSTTNPDNKFTYNGKELEDDHGLNWYHYGARFYDAQIGRWHVVDPVDELMSPYLFVKNNPVKFIDPDGKDVSIGKLLFENSEFRNWAENSFSFKLLVGLFGKGGPLEKYSVELNYFEPARTLKVPGRLDIMYNGKPLEIGAYTIDKEGNYSFVMRLNAGGEFWDKQGAKTGDHETSHLFYSTLQIVMGKKGDVKDIILLSGDRQHEEVAPGTEQSAALFDQILNTLGQDKANLPQGTVDQMKADGFIQVHDDRSGWQKFWDGVVSFFGGDSDNGQ